MQLVDRYAMFYVISNCLFSQINSNNVCLRLFTASSASVYCCFESSSLILTVKLSLFKLGRGKPPPQTLPLHKTTDFAGKTNPGGLLQSTRRF